jgi:hypothetical protein
VILVVVGSSPIGHPTGFNEKPSRMTGLFVFPSVQPAYEPVADSASRIACSGHQHSRQRPTKKPGISRAFHSRCIRILRAHAVCMVRFVPLEHPCYLLGAFRAA